jgi:hypothetical protein
VPEASHYRACCSHDMEELEASGHGQQSDPQGTESQSPCWPLEARQQFPMLPAFSLAVARTVACQTSDAARTTGNAVAGLPATEALAAHPPPEGHVPVSPLTMRRRGRLVPQRVTTITHLLPIRLATHLIQSGTRLPNHMRLEVGQKLIWRRRQRGRSGWERDSSTRWPNHLWLEVKRELVWRRRQQGAQRPEQQERWGADFYDLKMWFLKLLKQRAAAPGLQFFANRCL